ncbi:MAG: TIGR02206 family membrane protein [Saprospiraceae bacterium]|nr:TIGR02206 family membrane protein [Saprospiraceae bacterium]
MPFIMWYKSRILWAITFFWIMAGCAQSIITPTLTETLPHYEAIRYWAVHGVIILGALYGWYVYGYQLTWKDAVASVFSLNALAAVIYPINLFLGSNYMYLNAKPPGKTFYDLLGPWPDYILSLEFALLIFFSIILIPFYWGKIKPVLKLT